jgi:Flp pilus assembly secretin CpaC
LARPLLKRRAMMLHPTASVPSFLALIALAKPRAWIAAIALLQPVQSWPARPVSDPPPALPAVERPPLVLGQGEQRMVRAPGLVRYSLGGASLRAHALPKQGSILLKGVAPGNGDLWVWKSDGSSEHRTVRVEKIVSGELNPALEKALGRLEETEVLIAGTGVILRGRVRSLAESAKIRALSDAFGQKELRDETEPAEELLAGAQARIGEWIQATPYARGLKLEREGAALFVRGGLERPSLRATAEKALRGLYPQAAIELDSLPDSTPTVYFRVFLLELKKSRFHQLGLSWPAIQEGAFRVTSSVLTDALALDLALNALEGEGSLKILSNPELVVRAPGQAELFAGGELPIRTRSRRSANVEWKSYGLTLQLKVAQSSGERVRLEIFTEVSHLEPSPDSDSIPSIKANRMKTQVDARYGQPLLLSGLLQQNMRKQAKGLPVLRQIPVLGSLFGSEDYLGERSELVAILLPASAPPRDPMSRIARITPRGPVPPPRDWLSPDDERALKQSSEWPWNALK